MGAGSSTAATRSPSRQRTPPERFPDLVTIVAWHGCDHLAPVFENDVLATELSVEGAQRLEGGGGLVDLRARVQADRFER